MSKSLPRWTDRARLHPLEQRIFDLADEIEDSGADPLLTKVYCSLTEALHDLVDWFDEGQPGYNPDNRPLTIDDEALVKAGWEARKAHKIGDGARP